MVASIGSDCLLGTEALQSCLPHQLDLRMGQLWVEGRSTLQLHQQRLTPSAAAYLTSSVVLPPDSEVVVPVSVRSASGIQPGLCTMVEPCMDLTEDYGVIVGHTLVVASSWSASVLMVNPSADEIFLLCFTCLVPVLAVSVALAEPVLPGEVGGTLPDHLEDIVTGSYRSLGGGGGGWSDVAQEPSPSVRACFTSARGTCNRTNNIGTA